MKTHGNQLKDRHHREQLRLDTYFQGVFDRQSLRSKGMVVDLCAKGAGITLGTPFSVGQRGDFSIPLLKMDMKAEVRWCVPYQNAYRVGLRFEGQPK